MQNRDDMDAIEAALAGLRPHDATPARVERIRARCVAILEGRQREDAVRRSRLSRFQARLEQAIAFGLSALYLLSAVRSALPLFR